MLQPSAIVGFGCLFLSMVTVADACSAQGGLVWQQARTGNPPARSGFSMAYDAARQRVVLFGGEEFRDTWEWDGVSWTQATPVQRPPGRNCHSMAYDAARQRVVLFGGWDGRNGLALADTWEWDGVNWTNMSTTISPPARDNHSMTYDAGRQRVVLFGGWDRVSPPLQDTWEWDGVNWTQLSTAITPPARLSHCMTFDAGRRRVVLFGGRDWGTSLQDTWEWDGVNWIQATPAQSPGARSGHAMTYDSLRQRVVLFGGVELGASSGLSDTWQWDGVNWTQAMPSQSPPAQLDHAMAYDAARHRAVWCGGWSGTRALGTWECSSISPASVTNFGTGCPGTLGIPTLHATPFSFPWTGDTFTVELVNLPPGEMTFMVTGLSNRFWAGALIPLPASLMSWGMPGCTAYTDVVDSELLVNTIGTATSTKTIPHDAGLIGLTYYNQGFIIDSGVNSMGATVTNAAQATIGMR